MDFDDIFDVMAGGDDIPPGSAASAARGGILVVPEKAGHSSVLQIEERIYRASADLPSIVFEGCDPTTGETTFENASEFQKWMNVLRPPLIEEALAWSTERLSEIQAPLLPELDMAELDVAVKAPSTAAPGAGFVTSRAKMPHSTGRDRGQKR